MAKRSIPKKAARQRAPGAGRKPAGEGGAMVRDYPSVMVRLPVPTLAQLKALSAVRGMPVWRVVDAAVLAQVGTLTGDEAEDVRRMAKRELERLRAKLGTGASARAAGGPETGLPATRR